MTQSIASLLIAVCILSSCSPKIKLKAQKQVVALSATKGEKSKVDTLVFLNSGKFINSLQPEIAGADAKYFTILSEFPQRVNAKESIAITTQFHPDENFVGLANAQLLLNVAKDSVLTIALNGMSTKGLEGKNEPPLAWVTKTLGYAIDLGWDGLANHIRPDLQGEELPVSLFRASGKNAVEMIPVARYSPAFELPFGFYSVKNSLPVLQEVGVLAQSKTYPEHQTLFPKVELGSTSFTSKSEAFGFYTTSPSHVAYSEDQWNKKLFKKNAAHACRVYPVKNAQGVVLPNQFLVCFEEAFNGDYQDYVFLVKNVEVLKAND